MIRRSELRPLLVDLGVAGLCILAFWLPFHSRPRCPLPVDVALPVVLTAGLLMRSRWPAVSFALAAASTLVGLVLGVTTDPFTAAAWTLCAVAASRRGPSLSTTASVLLGVGVVASMTVGSPDPGVARTVVLSVLLLAGGWRLGAAIRQARTEAENAAAVEKQHAVLAERFYMAREIHDVVSHSLAAIAVTAGVGARPGSDPERLRPKLSQIERISQDALTDLRAVLGVVRHEGAAERGPRPGIESLPGLVDRAIDAGVPAELVVRGVDDVPSGIALAIYRIVQEGLTNATRHAPGAPCAVTVIGTDSHVHVDVIDGYRAPAAPSPAVASASGGGYGLLGLRERVESLGGAFTAGPRGRGGFAIQAMIPLPGSGPA